MKKNVVKQILLISIFLFLYSCETTKVVKKKPTTDKIYYASSGFALVYYDDLYKNKIVSKRISNDKIEVLHSSLKKNTPIIILNPETSLSIEAKVTNKSKYPNIFNIVISEKIASILKIDLKNPYIEIVEIKKNIKFIAKNTNTFDEEKNVAQNAPVEDIKVDDLNIYKKKKENNKKKNLSNYIIIIADFYYLESAKNLQKDLINRSTIKNILIKKVINNKYRLYVGPFVDFNALKFTYISLNKLGFYELNIYKNL